MSNITPGLGTLAPRAFALSLGTARPIEFDVVGVRGREGMSRLYHFDVTYVGKAAALAAATIGAPARLALRSSEGARFVHGIVSRVSSLGSTRAGEGRAAFFGERAQPLQKVRIIPRLGCLPLRKTSRIFQDQTTPEIIRAVAGEVGTSVEPLLMRQYAKREYCVQYQETDFDFITRLLAEEGLFYFFRHGAPDDESVPASEGGHEALVIADSPSHYPEVDGEPAIPLRDRGALSHDEAVFDFAPERRLRQGATLVRGFDYARPQFVPHAKSERAAPGQLDETALRSYDHDRVLEPTTVGKHVADLRLEELRAGAQQGRGRSNARRLVPGATFDLVEHTASDLNGRYVITELIHDGSDPLLGAAESAPVTYENRFRCAPASVAVRPSRPERRLHQVTETALVVGPPGEEIHTDALGRIKIQFHWDLEGNSDDKSSCWVRVMQQWAGPSWGTQLIPRVGMEVVVTFTGGDPDRPMVLGCVYNGGTPPPFTLPAEKTVSGVRTRSSPGGGGANQLSFEDRKGGEQIYLHAERDFDEVVRKDHTRTVHGHESIKVSENRIVEVQQDNVRVVRGSETLVIEKNLIMHVAGQHLMHIGMPPDAASDKDRIELPGDASRWAKFKDVASKPVFEDAAAARASKVRRSKMLWLTDNLSGDAHRASQFLVGRVADLDARVDAVCGEAHVMTGDILDLPLRLGDVAPGQDILADIRTRVKDLAERATDLEKRIAATIDENLETVAPIAAVQEVAVEHLAVKRERIRALAERLSGYTESLANAKELIAGFYEGGGGATTGSFQDAHVSFGNYLESDGKTKGAPPSGPIGSKLVINNGGEIEAPQGFKITCGGTYIEMTPGSITLFSPGPVKVNGTNVFLNC